MYLGIVVCRFSCFYASLSSDRGVCAPSAFGRVRCWLFDCSRRAFSLTRRLFGFDHLDVSMRRGQSMLLFGPNSPPAVSSSVSRATWQSIKTMTYNNPSFLVAGETPMSTHCKPCPTIACEYARPTPLPPPSWFAVMVVVE